MSSQTSFSGTQWLQTAAGKRTAPAPVLPARPRSCESQGAFAEAARAVGIGLAPTRSTRPSFAPGEEPTKGTHCVWFLRIIS